MKRLTESGSAGTPSVSVRCRNVWKFRPTGVSWNSGAVRIFGYTAEEVIGQPDCSRTVTASLGEHAPNKAKSATGAPE